MANRKQPQADMLDLSRTPETAQQPWDRPGDRRPGIVALWDIEDVSRYLRVPVSAVYKMTVRTATMRIPHIRLGGRLRFRQDEIDEWLSLLSTSNSTTLRRLRRKALEVTHGNDP